ncbi:response regulator [Nitrospira sp. T9]|uniref:response regulator n=1 Tax=Nitrospira sp. T9 TaxID=3456077 RepID=UPI003F967387
MNVNSLTGRGVASIELETKDCNGWHPEHEPDLPDSGKRIVVLGVDLKTWTGLTENLWDLGFTLQRLPSSLQGLDQLKNAFVDGVLWDCESSSLTGLAVVSQFCGRMPVPPVMVISSPSNKKLLIKALENGAMDFIMKPIDHMELRNKCVRLFG